MSSRSSAAKRLLAADLTFEVVVGVVKATVEFKLKRHSGARES